MIFKKLTIQNFLSIKDVKINLDNQGLVLIQGRNLDNDSLNNNGAGKSSIIEALVYAIYGKTLRGVKTDAVVNKVAKKNTKVFLDFVDDDGVEYRIARYRKHSVNRNRSLVYRNGVDITPKSESDFNDFIADLLQMDYLTFTSSILYSAESFKFTSATDSEMKNTFDMMLGLDVFTKCLELAKSKLKKVDDELSSSEWKIDTLKSQIEQLDSRIEDAKESSEEYKHHQKEKINALKISIKGLLDELEEYKKQKEQAEEVLSEKQELVSTTENKHKSVKKKLSQIEQLKKVVYEINSDIRDMEHDIKSIDRDISSQEKSILRQQSEISDLNNSIQKYEQKKSKLDEEIGQPCPTCGQPMTEKSIQPAKEEYDNKIGKAEKSIEECNSEIEECNSEIENLKEKKKSVEESIEENKADKENYEKLIEKSRDLIDEESQLDEEVNELKEELSAVKLELSVIDVKIESVTSNLEKAKEELEKADESNPYEDMIEKYKEEQGKHQKEIDSIKLNTQELLDEKECLLFWQQAYSNQGIKSFILDDITPFLNRRVNKYLKKLASNHIEVVFSTQTQLKSGETREKFSIEILNQDGGSEYIANSSGERRRIDLAVNLALQDLVASRSNKKVNVAIFDEAFDTLDNIGVERVIELLQELAQEKSSIFVISHNEHLKSYFTNTVTIIKKNGCSVLLEAEESEETENDM